MIYMFNKNKILTLIIVISVFPLLLKAQTEVKGFIFDYEDKQPMHGVSVWEQHTKNGTVSNLHGEFSITISDTSKLIFAFIGYERLAIDDFNDIGDSIFMHVDTTVYLAVDYVRLYKYYRLGLYSDFNQFPYGIIFDFFRKWSLFKIRGNFTSNLKFKTDLKSNYDFKLTFNNGNIYLNRLNLSVSSSFQKRNINNLIIQDYEIAINKHFYNRFNSSLGFIYRHENLNMNKSDKGINLGIGVLSKKFTSSISGSIGIYKNDIEYSINVYRSFRNRKTWNHFTVGACYNNYIYYDEFNLFLRYDLRYYRF